MNNVVKGLLIFFGGTIVGGGASFFLTKSVLDEKKEKEISDRVQDALAQCKAHELSKLNNDIKEEIKDRIIGSEQKDNGSILNPSFIDMASVRENYKKKSGRYRIDVDIPVDEPKSAPEENDIPEDEVVMEKHNAFVDSKHINEDDISEEEEGEDDSDGDEPKKSAKEPYIISPEEFQYDHQDDYEKESFIFFKDHILTDEDYKEISKADAETLLGGPKIFTAFGSKGAKDNLVYIRNEMLHTDYEVYHSPRKYTTDVLHMEDEEEE